MIVDDDIWTLRYLVVNTSDWWLGHQVPVAPAWISDISWLDATVTAGCTASRRLEADGAHRSTQQARARDTSFAGTKAQQRTRKGFALPLLRRQLVAGAGHIQHIERVTREGAHRRLADR